MVIYGGGVAICNGLCDSRDLLMSSTDSVRYDACAFIDSFPVIQAMMRMGWGRLMAWVHEASHTGYN